MSINFFKHNLLRVIKTSFCKGEMIPDNSNFIISINLIKYKILNR